MKERGADEVYDYVSFGPGVPTCEYFANHTISPSTTRMSVNVSERAQETDCRRSSTLSRWSLQLRFALKLWAPTGAYTAIYSASNAPGQTSSRISSSVIPCRAKSTSSSEEHIQLRPEILNSGSSLHRSRRSFGLRVNGSPILRDWRKQVFREFRTACSRCEKVNIVGRSWSIV